MLCQERQEFGRRPVVSHQNWLEILVLQQRKTKHAVTDKQHIAMNCQHPLYCRQQISQLFQASRCVKSCSFSDVGYNVVSKLQGQIISTKDLCFHSSTQLAKHCVRWVLLFWKVTIIVRSSLAQFHRQRGCLGCRQMIQQALHLKHTEAFNLFSLGLRVNLG